MSLSADEDHRRALGRLTRYITEAQEILASWDTYSDEHTDADGWPHDPIAYGYRQRRRDAETWEAFAKIRFVALTHLLPLAERQLPHIPTLRVRPSWSWQLKTLRTSLDEIYRLQESWLAERDALPDRAVPGTQEYDEPLADRNAEAWHYLDTWAVHGQALLDINTAAQQGSRHRADLTTAAVISTAGPKPLSKRTP
ncbi:hypothetical protein AB0469_01450 [Streptomyces sp. NPDC093801]|uniref:hypothetical protein n=1 Tax=Streptomyces sp. NPDC093801 TaxID=3155203 RepID=UPI00344DCE59